MIKNNSVISPRLDKCSEYLFENILKMIINEEDSSLLDFDYCQF